MDIDNIYFCMCILHNSFAMGNDSFREDGIASLLLDTSFAEIVDNTSDNT